MIDTRKQLFLVTATSLLSVRNNEERGGAMPVTIYFPPFELVGEIFGCTIGLDMILAGQYR